MRKHLFIGLLSIQLIIIALFVYFITMVETYGQGFQVLTKPDVYSYNDSEALSGYFPSFNYDIEQISDDKWPVDLDGSTGQPLYVLLRENEEGIYEWKDVSTKKWKQINDNEMIIHASYSHYDDYDRVHYLDYPFKRNEPIDHFGSFYKGDTLLITVHKGLSDYYIITDIQTYE